MAYRYSFDHLNNGQFVGYVTSDDPEHVEDYNRFNLRSPIKLAATASVRVQPSKFTLLEDEVPDPEPDGQGRLFSFDETPAQIKSLYADPRISSKAVTTLLALAIGRHPNPTVDDNLSQYSAPIARKGVDMGLVQPNDANPQSKRAHTSYQRYAGDHTEVVSGDGYVVDSTPFSDAEIEHARSTVRNFLRPAKEKPHPQLPGLEDG